MHACVCEMLKIGGKGVEERESGPKSGGQAQKGGGGGSFLMRISYGALGWAPYLPPLRPGP